MSEVNFLEILFDSNRHNISIIVNVWIAVAFIVIFLILKIAFNFLRNKKTVSKEIIPVSLKYSLGGSEVEYKIVRDYTNVEIAHKIYIELVTRKAAIPIDENNDVIIEIYNSWYCLFQIIREELKTISGKLLRDNDTSNDLIKLLVDLLNCGLRPHLTQYQALFRKWYSEELENSNNVGKSPQSIQKGYKNYNLLIASMKEVNALLIKYTNELKSIVNGKNVKKE